MNPKQRDAPPRPKDGAAPARPKPSAAQKRLGKTSRAPGQNPKKAREPGFSNSEIADPGFSNSEIADLMEEEIQRGVHNEDGNRCSQPPPPYEDCVFPSEMMGEPENGEVVSKRPSRAPKKR